VAIDLEGRVVGATIEEQTRVTVENCRRQLETAGVGLGDVFKANIYLRDLADWSRFNAVYEELMPRPLPVRTAVQTVLLNDFLIEIEMWAIKPDR